MEARALFKSYQSAAKLAQQNDLTVACIHPVWEISCKLYCCTAQDVRSQDGLFYGQNTYNMLLQAVADVTPGCHLRVVHAPNWVANQDSVTFLQSGI